MRWNSIRTKVAAALVVCLVVGLTGILVLMRYSFEHSSQVLADEAVSGAQKLFAILESREISKMTAVSDVLLTNPEVRSAFSAKDRDRLLQVTAPLYSNFKAQGITNWMFHTPEPKMAVFHNPPKYGDELNRFFDKKVSRTHGLVAGNELAKAGFATADYPALL
jgi:methyl-accepting chemotaxis protein